MISLANIPVGYAQKNYGVAPVPGELRKVQVGSASTRHNVMPPAFHSNVLLPPGLGSCDTLRNVASIPTS